MTKIITLSLIHDFYYSESTMSIAPSFARVSPQSQAALARQRVSDIDIVEHLTAEATRSWQLAEEKRKQLRLIEQALEADDLGLDSDSDEMRSSLTGSTLLI